MEIIEIVSRNRFSSYWAFHRFWAILTFALAVSSVNGGLRSAMVTTSGKLDSDSLLVIRKQNLWGAGER